MSSWTLDAFNSPAAQEWIEEAILTNDSSAIEEAIFMVLDNGDAYLELAEAQTALAAIETVAAILGRPSASFSEQPELVRWLARVRPDGGAALAIEGRRVLVRILATESELREYWEDTDEFDAWLASIYDLRERLLPY